MFVLIFLIVYHSFLIVCILDLLFKNKGLEKDLEVMSCEITKYRNENSRLRKELKNVL